MEKSERRIIIEIATPEVVSRLKADNEELSKKLKEMERKHNALHETVYRLMEVVSELRRNKGKS